MVEISILHLFDGDKTYLLLLAGGWECALIVGHNWDSDRDALHATLILRDAVFHDVMVVWKRWKIAAF